MSEWKKEGVEEREEKEEEVEAALTATTSPPTVCPRGILE